MAQYRDSKTGQFVSAATWKRSKAHGGTRYKRLRAPAPPAKASKPKRPPKAPQKPAKRQRKALSEPMAEYVLHFDYGRKRKRNLIRFQVHIFAPKRLTDQEVIDGIKKWDRTGKLPDGFKKETITWGRPHRANVTNETDSRTDNVQGSAIQHGRARVRRKNSV